jgi:hypothetical protein
MTSIADGPVVIQPSAESAPSTPSWFGEVVLIAAHLRTHDVLTKITEQVRFARRRFGCYDVIDFLAVLFGYAISGERTLEEFYERLQPFAVPFMALFERDRLPSRSALSRFLAALPRGRDHSAGNKKSPVGVTRRGSLRTVRKAPAATRIHCLRCGRAVPASRGL